MAEKLFRDPFTGPEPIVPVKSYAVLYQARPGEDAASSLAFGSQFWDDSDPAPAASSGDGGPTRGRRVFRRRI